MEEKELKTSTRQRIIIGLIAFIMVGSIIASYAVIVMNGSQSSSDSDSNDDTESEVSEEQTEEYKAAYEKKLAEFTEATKSDYAEFSKYRSEVKAYNETSANESGVQKKDLKEGSGDTVDNESGSNYLAYYIGWCADETIFDSSLDDRDKPTSFVKALDPSLGMIEGWTKGVEGMKIGGVREITVPGELAYGDSMELCGGTNKPLKFIVMAVPKKDPLKTLAEELDTAYMRYQYAAMYGVDYDKIQASGE